MRYQLISFLFPPLSLHPSRLPVFPSSRLPVFPPLHLSASRPLAPVRQPSIRSRLLSPLGCPRTRFSPQRHLPPPPGCSRAHFAPQFNTSLVPGCARARFSPRPYLPLSLGCASPRFSPQSADLLSGPNCSVSGYALVINKLSDYYTFKTRHNSLATLVQPTRSRSHLLWLDLKNTGLPPPGRPSPRSTPQPHLPSLLGCPRAHFTPQPLPPQLLGCARARFSPQHHLPSLPGCASPRFSPRSAILLPCLVLI